MVKKVEVLENHAHFLAQFVQMVALGHDVLPVHPDFSAGGRLQHVDGPKKRAFPRSGRADDANHLPLLNLAVHILEDGDLGAVRIGEGLA